MFPTHRSTSLLRVFQRRIKWPLSSINTCYFHTKPYAPAVVDPSLQAIIEQVKVDILTPTQMSDNEKLLEKVSRNFVSDTITVPTKAMYDYAVRGSIGDDVFHDPCTVALEQHMARLTGKEAGLFVSSGTLGNQLAIRTHLHQPPFSIITDARSHVNKYEAGGAAMHSGAHSIPLTPLNGHHLTLEDIKNKVASESDKLHVAPTRLICLENTLDGTIFPQDDIMEISKFARGNNIMMHLDGARLWHAAVETGMSLKGLGAPVGACLVGSTAFISKARWLRKAFGGGMRQTGILAACAAYALNYNFQKLPQVHALARRLQQGLEDLGVGTVRPAETCMVFYDPSTIGVEYKEVGDYAAALPSPITLSGSRLVAHIQTTTGAIDDFLQLMRELRNKKAKGGSVPSAEKVINIYERT